MTREDVKVSLPQCKSILFSAKNGMTDIELQLMLNRFIDKIYDDFESRTCENCIHLKYIEKSYKQCDELGINIGCETEKEFSCNMFERKEN